MPIIKANAYGHGLVEMAKILRTEKTTALGVAYGEEALRFRGLGYRGRIVVLSFWRREELTELVKNKVELVAWDFASLAALTTVAQRSIHKPKVHIKLDTGTSRIGFLASDIPKLRTSLVKKNNLKVVGLFSHFANAEERETIRTKKQLERFATLEHELGLDSRVGRHIACTAAILRYPEARFGLVRLGIGLYGIWPSGEIKVWTGANLSGFSLQPALSWYTSLAQVKVVQAGTAIGYGSTVVARRRLTIGILPIGYADGLDRRLSNRGYVMIRGHRAKIIGRICMNLCMVDLTKIPRAKTGDPVTVIGHGASLEDMAINSGALNYELVTRLNWNIPRYIT